MFDFVILLYGTLHKAASEGNLSTLLYLLKKRKQFIDQYSNSGYTPLQIAFISNKKECLIALLEAGADVKIPIRNHFTYPILQICTKNHIKWSMLRLLMSYGASIDGITFKEKEAKEYARALKAKVDIRNDLLHGVEQRLSTGHVNFLSEANVYKSIGDFWYELFIEESQYEHCNEIFRDHYWNKAVGYYQKMGELLMELPKGSQELAEYQLFFERIIDECSTRKPELVTVFSEYAAYLVLSEEDEQIQSLDVNMEVEDSKLRQRFIKKPT